MDLNRAQVLGNMVRDPEIRTVPSGQNVCSFSVATNLIWNNQNGERQQKVEYHNIVAWRKLADICGQYLKKGRKVYVEGRLQTRSWEDQNGVKKYRTEIIADNVILVDRPGGATSTVGDQPSEAEAPQVPKEEQGAPPVKDSSKKEEKSSGSGDSSEEEIDVNDIPF